MSAEIINLNDKRNAVALLPGPLLPHPLADKYSLLGGADFEQLKADIERQGLLSPIWLYEGKILDGRNRYRACMELGIAPRTALYTGGEPAQFAWALNGVRRLEQFTPSQRACIAVDMLPEIEAESRRRQLAELRRGTEFPVPLSGPERELRGDSVEIAARIVGCSPSSVKRAKQISIARPDLLEKARAGETTVGHVATQIREARMTVETPAKPDTPPAREPGTERPTTNGRTITRGSPIAVSAEKVRAMASEGMCTAEIARALNFTQGRISQIARTHGIKIAIPRQRKEAARRYANAVEQTVLAMAGYALGLRTVSIELSGITNAMAADWLESLSDSMQAINAVRKSLKGIANAKE